MPSDPYELSRFLDAQGPIYARALAELRAGRKRSHWMWFVFPQIAGLGHSAMAARYAISSLDEAKAYLAHNVLGPRLRDCTEAVLAIEGRDAHAIFGSPDDLKFRSSMTLFAQADGSGPFERALEKFFEGRLDARTMEMLRSRAP